MKPDIVCKDLVVLTADKNMKFAVEGLINRPQSIDIRKMSAEFYIHPESDPGCFLRSDAFLRPFVKLFDHALVMFDREGCGGQNKQREELENEVFMRLSQSGWGDRTDVIVIDPELENWVFSNSPEVDAAIGWAGKKPSLREWLINENFLTLNQEKPSHPKEAMEAALRHARMPRSSSIYAQLAGRVSLNRCTDPSFLKFKKLMRSWFPLLEDKA